MLYSKKLSLVLIGGQEDYECFSIITSVEKAIAFSTNVFMSIL